MPEKPHSLKNLSGLPPILFGFSEAPNITIEFGLKAASKDARRSSTANSRDDFKLMAKALRRLAKARTLTRIHQEQHAAYSVYSRIGAQRSKHSLSMIEAHLKIART